MIGRRIALVFSILLNIVLVYSLIWGQQGAISYKDLKEQCAKLEVTIEELDGKNLVLSREIRLLQHDEKYVEKMIRKRLNFVKDNEILYVFPEIPESVSAGVVADETKN